jgi:hypothetical protein
MATIAAQPVQTDQVAFRIRPLGLGGSLDQAILLLRHHVGPLLKTSLAITAVPMFVAFYIGFGGIEEAVRPLSIPGQGRPEDIWVMFEHMGLVMLPLLFVAYRVIEPFALAALIYQSAAILHGQPPAMGNSIRHSLRRVLPLCVMWLIRWLCIKVGLVFCYIPGILLAGLFITALPAVVLEGAGPFGGLGRSIDLTKKRFLPAVGLAVVLFMIEYNVTGLAQMVPVSAATAVAHALLYAAVLPVYAAAVTTFYFAGRCLTENYDLQVLTAEVAAGPADETAPESSPYVPVRERWSPEAADLETGRAADATPAPPAADTAPTAPAED